MAIASRYETYEQLGKGSTGTVSRALDVVLAKEVALKVLNPESRFSSRLLDFFFTDEQAASEWLHPNVAVIHDLGQSPAGSFVATELLTGATMRSHIEKRSDFSLEQKLDLMVQACCGLGHAHTKGVVHAAVTPGSFFITSDKQLKILDLGIRLVGARVPAPGDLGGMTYLAPEQVWEQSCDVRSDVFSAAVVFFEFLLYVHPFAHGIAPRAGPDGGFAHLTISEGSLPESLATLLKRALSASPDERPQSAFEFAASLREVELEISSPLMHRFGDRPRFADRPHAEPDKSWEGHSNVRPFLELFRQFETNLSLKKWEEARQSLQTMKSLSTVQDDEEFIPAILDSEKRLERAQQSDVSSESSTQASLPDNGGAMPALGTRVQASEPGRTRRPRLRPLSFPVLGSVVVAVLLLTAAYFASNSKQVRSKAVLAQARVQAPETSLLESPEGSSRQLATLKKGVWVNILDRIPTKATEYVRATQFIHDKRELPSGYVRVSDLGNWLSDDSEVSWGLLALDTPSVGSERGVIEQYLADLESYRTRFPKSDRMRAIDSEAERWREVLAYAPKPYSAAPADRIPDQVADVGVAPGSTPVPSPDALGPVEEDKVKRILARIPPLWDEGNLEGILELSRQAILIDPENSQAKMWRAKARNALRKLSDQP